MTETNQPVIDLAYIEELRGWVGTDTLVGLAVRAPEVFTAEAEAVLAAWKSGAAEELRASAHRLKGVAGSLACARLSQVCQLAQLRPHDALSDPELGARLDRELAAALGALKRLFPPQP
jgi:HPt (histidine-containing phosphotransfer) domain-containing protein